MWIVTKKRLSFFLRWFVRYNTELYYMQAKMPELPERSDRHLARLLNDRRQESHMEILDATEDYRHLCSGCGRCCLERVERYTDFDQFIHEGIGEPLEHYDRTILRFPSMVLKSVKRALERSLGKDGKAQKPCRYLGESGCTIPQHKRPILCVSWFCPKYIFEMQPATLDSLEKPLHEILLIHRTISETVASKKVG